MKITEINFSIKNIAVFAGLAALASMIYKTGDIILMFLASVLIAYILNPIVNFFERLRVGRTLGVFILALVTGAVLLLLLGLALPVIIEDTIYFLNNVPDYVSRFFAFTEKILTRLGVEVSLESVRAFIIERIGMITRYALNTVTTAAASVKGIVMLILNLVLIPVLVFFLLKDFPKVKEFTNALVERLRLQTFMAHLTEFETLIGRYFRGMFFVGLVLSALYITTLLIIGVKGAVLLGLLTGMGGMIPYVGFTVGIIVSVTLAAVQFQDFIHPLYVVLGFTVVQILESTVITPKIVGDSMGLNPVLVIFALMMGGALFGLIGMIIALPIAAFIKIMLNKYFFKKEPAEENAGPETDGGKNHDENDVKKI